MQSILTILYFQKTLILRTENKMKRTYGRFLNKNWKKVYYK